MAKIPDGFQLRTDGQHTKVNGSPSRGKHSWTFLRIDFIVPFLFVGTIVLAFIIIMQESKGSGYIKYTTVTGFFQQDDPETDAGSFDYTTTNFGLIDRSYDTDADYDPNHISTQWQRFAHHVSQLNHDGGQKVRYKVLFMGRHGEGDHNVAEAYYGTAAWDCYWSKLDGNGTVIWADAHLTEEGVAQAVKANNFWRKQILEQTIPTPEKYYTSPLTRCLATANITFSGLDLPGSHPFIPEIKELFREVIGVHTCDRRSSKTYIHNHFPNYTFEEAFKEDDPLWDAFVRETSSAQDARSKVVLDDVFSSEESTYISISSHSGEIGSILRVLGHREFRLGTGQVIPVLVKAETIYGTSPSSMIVPYTTASTCTAPPATSSL